MNHHGPTKEKSDRDAEILRERAEYLADLRATFGSEHGKRVLAAIRSRCGYDYPAFVRAPGSKRLDPFAAAIRDGRRAVFQELLDDLATPEDGRGKSPEAVR